MLAFILYLSLISEDWPRFLGPRGDNTSTQTKIITDWSQGLKKLWDCPLGESFGPPSVADGKLYHFDIVDKNAVLTCRDGATGKELWNFSYPCDYRDQYGYDGTRCCPVIDGDRVYIYGPDGILHCVSGGKKVWQMNTVEKFHVIPNFFGVSSVPVVEKDLLIVAVGGSPKGQGLATVADAKPDGSAIVAFDKLTGEVKYQCGDELASFSSPVIVTMHNQRVGFYYARGGLLAFDPVNGKQIAHFPWRSKIFESAIAANPVVSNDRILISESYEIGSAFLKYDGKAFEPVWTDRKRDADEKALLAHWCTPIEHDGCVYACSSRHSPHAEMRCIKLETGEILWREKATRWFTLVKVDGHLLSVHETGELRLIKPNEKKYEETARWKSPDLTHPCWAPPVIAQGRLYVRGNGKLICYEFTK